MPQDLRDQLRDLFGLDDFRPAQREVIGEVLEGRDVLCVMPTGAGKSLCYQLPTYVQKGLTLVISPLISLMRDQVAQLRDEGLEAMFINSQQTPQEQHETLDSVIKGFQGLLYVAPERFAAPAFIRALTRIQPKLLAIDEAHCISMWGHDFRPDYGKIGDVRRAMGNPPTIALTATATQEVRDDIVAQLGMTQATAYVTGFDRPNLRYECRKIDREAEKLAELLDIVRKTSGAGIVYCSKRSTVDELSSLLKTELKSRAVFGYHAGMDPAARSGAQEGWMSAPDAVAIATNAFGMGINRPDTRFVVHYNIPGTLEAYYQEAGRAGRDGQPADCVLLFSHQDIRIQEFFHSKIGEGREDLDVARIEALKQHAADKLDLLISYARTHRCRRQMILDYFGDDTEAADCNCDVCRRSRGGLTSTGVTIDVSDAVNQTARKLLSGIARVSLKGSFGVGAIAEVLAGEHSERTTRWGFDQLTVFGLMSPLPAKRIIPMLYRLMEAGLARQRDPEGQRFRPVVEMSPAGVAVMKGEQRAPGMLADLLGHSTRPTFKKPKPQLVQISPNDPALQARVNRLRAARMELARAKQLPAYCILHDATLIAIANAAPKDLAALELVKGMGPRKVEQYGQALLDALGEG